MLVDLLLGSLALGCCLVAPALAVAAPFALGARALVRRRPGARAAVAAGASIAAAIVTGVALGAAGLAFGLSIGDESAGTAMALLAGGGLAGGALAGLLATLTLVLAATRAPRALPGASSRGPGPTAPPGDFPSAAPPSASPDGSRLGAWVLGVSVAALVLGVATSLAGLVFSVSIGMISLAIALVLMRPLALAFVTIHLGTCAAAVLAERRGGARARTRAALGVGVLGALLATAIAVFGPGFLERAIEGVARGLVV